MAFASGRLAPERRGSGLALLTTATSLARLLASVLFGVLWTRYGVETAVRVFLIGLGTAIAIAVVVLRDAGRARGDDDRSDRGSSRAGRPWRVRTRTARVGNASSRVIAFILLCVAAVALAAGYAWWSTARRASFVQDVTLPPIGSLAELDSPARAGAIPPPTSAGAGSAPATVKLPRDSPTDTAPIRGSLRPDCPPDQFRSRPRTSRIRVRRRVTNTRIRRRNGRAACGEPSGRHRPERPVQRRPTTRREGRTSSSTNAGRDLLFRHTGLDESFGVVERGAAGSGGGRGAPRHAAALRPGRLRRRTRRLPDHRPLLRHARHHGVRRRVRAAAPASAARRPQPGAPRARTAGWPR